MNRPITDYKVLQLASVRTLTAATQKAIAEGWEPLGGVECDGERYLQTVVQYDNSQGDLICGDVHDLNNKVPRL